MWPFCRKGSSGFSSSSTAEQVTEGIDGSNLTAITTGASSGIGRETARVLTLRGVHVIIGVRNLSAGNIVKEEIVKEIPKAKIDVLELDLSSLDSVKKFASDFSNLNLPLNILINNAGIMATPYTLSKDGIELQFATNHIGHFLLTNLVLENMKITARKTNIEGRIVILASEGHKLTYPEGIRFDKINEKSGYSSFYTYGESKLANILHANELSKRLREEGVNITANSLHPGVIATNLFKYHSFINALTFTLGKMATKSIPQGAATTCYVALNPQVKGVTGKYFNNSNLSTPSAKATDEELAKKLWDFSVNIISA